MNLLTPRRKRPAVTGSYSVAARSRGAQQVLCNTLPQASLSAAGAEQHQFQTAGVPALLPPGAFLPKSGAQAHLLASGALALQGAHAFTCCSSVHPCLAGLGGSAPTTGHCASTPVPPSTYFQQVGEVDEVDTPGRDSLGSSSASEQEEDQDQDQPPLPPRTPAPVFRLETGTPTSLSPGVRRELETPRSRGGLMVS